VAVIPSVNRPADARSKETGVRVVGATMPPPGTSMRSTWRAAGRAWAPEGQGLRRLTRERCDELAAFPLAGQVES